MLLACVRCNSVLDKARISDIEVDLCPACGGLWLDRGEIERIGHLPAEQIEALRHALTGGRPAGLSDVQNACPACPGPLAQVTLGPVVVDFCRRCGGVFLDRGELDAALAATRDTTLAHIVALAGSLAK